MSVQLTFRQARVLGFMVQFFADNDQLPPMHAISSQFGFKSNNSSQDYVNALERKGYLERNAVGNYRFVRERVLGLLQKAGWHEPVHGLQPLEPGENHQRNGGVGLRCLPEASNTWSDHECACNAVRQVCSS